MMKSNIFEQKLLGATLFTPKALIDSVGRIAASLLQQLHYALQNSKFQCQGKYWVSMTQEQWAEKLMCSVKTIQRAFARLESLGLVISDRLHKQSYYQRKSYRVNYEVLVPLLEKESKRLEAPRQKDFVDADILSDSNNKSLNKEFKEQHTSQIVENQEPLPSHHPVSVSGIDKEAILVDPPIPDKGGETKNLGMDGSTDQIEEVQKTENTQGIGNSTAVQRVEEIQEPETIPGMKEVQLSQEAGESQPELDPALEAEIVKTVGHKIGAGLRKLALNASLEVIENALIIVKTTENARNKAGLFYRAIQEQWVPSAAAMERQKKRLDPDFNEWWGYVRQLGLAVASVRDEDQLWIYPAHNSLPHPYEEFRAMFSMSWLKRKLQQE